MVASPCSWLLSCEISNFIVIPATLTRAEYTSFENEIIWKVSGRLCKPLSIISLPSLLL
jgi:hypothetical protein